jgi:hypothetical protein
MKKWRVYFELATIPVYVDAHGKDEDEARRDAVHIAICKGWMMDLLKYQRAEEIGT